MVVVTVHDLAAAREGGDDNQRNPGAIAEEIERLKESRVEVTAALVKGNQEGGLLKQFAVGLELIKNVLDHGLEEIELRARRVSINKAVGLYKGDRRQFTLVEAIEEVDCVLDVRITLLRIAHDRLHVRERVADVAVVEGDELIHRISRAVGDSHRCFEAAAKVSPGNLLLIEGVTDGAQTRRRHFAACHDIGAVDIAVRQKAGAEIVDHVEMPRIAIWRGVPRQTRQIAHDWSNSGLSEVGAVGPRLIALEGRIGGGLGVGISDAGERRVDPYTESFPEKGIG